MKTKSSCLFSFASEGLSNDGVVGVARGTVFEEIRPGAGFRTSDFVKETLGGLPSRKQKKNDSLITLTITSFCLRRRNIDLLKRSGASENNLL